MVEIVMEFQCECFKRSGYDAIQQFESKDLALVRANDMVADMNESFCGAHGFGIHDDGDRVVITVKNNF